MFSKYREISVQRQKRRYQSWRETDQTFSRVVSLTSPIQCGIEFTLKRMVLYFKVPHLYSLPKAQKILFILWLILNRAPSPNCISFSPHYSDSPQARGQGSWWELSLDSQGKSRWSYRRESNQYHPHWLIVPTLRSLLPSFILSLLRASFP